MTTPEGRVKAKVKARLKRDYPLDCWAFMPVQMGMGSPALDFLICIKGIFVSIETKVLGKSLTDRQQLTRSCIHAAGGLVLVVWDDETLDYAMASIALKLKAFGL